VDRKEYIKGLFLGSIAFVIWGLLPLYWRMVAEIGPYQQFAQRIVWSFVFVLVILRVRKELGHFIKLVSNRRNWSGIILPALAISVNWLTYIWAVNNGFVLEASLGYYMNPLVLTLIGAVFLKETIRPLERLGLAFALVGVIIKTLHYGEIPIVALILAFSFAFYGAMKKKSPLKSLYGLGFETMAVCVPALGYVLYSEGIGNGIMGNLPGYFWFLIAISGIATAAPLILYAESAKRLPLNVLGFLQYIAPTFMLFLGIFVFDEPFDWVSAIAFGLIWIALMVFSYSQYRFLTDKKKTAIELPS